MTTLSRLLQRSARWYGDATAVTDEHRSATFREVIEAAARFANALSELAPRTSDRVALLVPNRSELLELDIGIVLAGKVKVPVNTRLRQDERAHVINDCGAAVLVFDGTEEQAVGDLLPSLANAPKLIRVGDGGLGESYSDVLIGALPWFDEAPVGDDQPSMILYTSGTTGRPKGATTTFDARLAGTVNMLTSEIDPRPGDAMAHVGSMAHGSGSKAMAHFLRGSRNIPIARFDPERFLSDVERFSITHTFVVPTMIESLVAARPDSPADLTSLRSITYGGAPISPSRLAHALDTMGTCFVQVYGSCEAPHPVLVLPAAEHVDVDDRLASAGRESLGYETALVDKDGRPAAEGEPGELIVRGRAMMSGYWQQPEATSDVLHAGWYHTGDIVRRSGDGYVHIIDRARDVIITGGYNVYPAELESVLSQHPDVAEVAVIGVPDEYWGESVKAIVVPHGRIDVDSLLDHCSQRLAGYKRPRSVELVGSLPRGSTGKVLRRDLRDAYWGDRERRV